MGEKPLLQTLTKLRVVYRYQLKEIAKLKQHLDNFIASRPWSA